MCSAIQVTLLSRCLLREHSDLSQIVSTCTNFSTDSDTYPGLGVDRSWQSSLEILEKLLTTQLFSLSNSLTAAESCAAKCVSFSRFSFALIHDQEPCFRRRRPSFSSFFDRLAARASWAINITLGSMSANRSSLEANGSTVCNSPSGFTTTLIGVASPGAASLAN